MITKNTGKEVREYVREGTNKEFITKPATVMTYWSSSHWGVLGHGVEHVSEFIPLRRKKAGVVFLQFDCQHLPNNNFSLFKAF